VIKQWRYNTIMKMQYGKNESDTRARLLDAAFQEVYKNGYHGAATAAILKAADVPKGSMYHFFASKKELVLAVVKERIFPRMDRFFDFSGQENRTAFQTIEETFRKMGEHELLIASGCPLHRLMVEMAPLDSDFERLLNSRFEHFVSGLDALLTSAVKAEEFRPFDTRTFARFMITSTWGALSVSPSLSSPETFSKHTDLLLELLQHRRSAH
jgi:TetR/AcrR family transcriptional repressor of nem operon